MNPTAYRESLFIGLTRSDLFGYVGAACPAPGLTPGTDLSMHPGQLQENQLKPAYQMPNLIMITGGGKDGTVGLLFITISCLQMELNISGILFLMEGMIHLAFSRIFITIFVGFFKVKNDFLPNGKNHLQ